MTGSFDSICTEVQSFFGILRTGYNQKRITIEKMQNKLKEYDSMISCVEDAMNTCFDNNRVLEIKYKEAKSAYEEYDLKYQAIDSERIRIENQREALLHPDT